MLLNLKIENIAVISSLEVEFGAGLNVLTGETGAGKSVVLDTVYAVTGRRFQKDLIRTGQERARISALFTEINGITKRICGDWGVDCPDGELLLERTLFKDGKSLCRANGHPLTVSGLRAVSEYLIDIHGQQDNRQLLDVANHLSILDAYAKNAEEFDNYTKAFENLHGIKKRLKCLYEQQNDITKRADELRATVNELETAKIVPGEAERLKAARLKIRNGEKIQTAIANVLAKLEGGDEDPGAISMMKDLMYETAGIADVYSKASGWQETANDIYYELDALCESVREESESLNYSETELEKTEERISMYAGLFRKYGTDEEGLLEILDKSRGELDSLSDVGGQISALEKAADDASVELVSAGERLTASRVKAGGKFADSVCDVLKYLQMPNVIFTVKHDSGPYTKTGCDRVEFMISANAGESAGPLNKIASGGEMSRIMLAIKSVLLSADKTDTLIFDEIDAGISGYAASRVGEKMKELSRDKQILCVTHLAQIAARADFHFLVSKEERDGRTFTSLTPLEGDDRIREIARIMSGGRLTENLYRSAKELLMKGMNRDETV